MWSNYVTPERLARLQYPQTVTFLGILTLALVVVSVLVRIKATVAFDLMVTKYLQQTSGKVLNALAGWMTFLGNTPTLLVLALAVVGICWYAGFQVAGVYALASLVSAPINVVLKGIFDRERPGAPHVNVLPGPRWGTSYPSGHSMCSAAFYGFLAVIIWLHMVQPVARIMLFSVFASLPLFIGASRIYVGAHWLSDVIGGLAGGAIILAVLAVLYPV